MFYCFQPIFSARSGRVVAYEALMRSDLPTLRSPATIMKLAREQGALWRDRSAPPLPRRWRPSTACAGRAACPGMPCSLSTPSPTPA
ncbi:MAG: EAL domain-containing protein [Faecalibacterium prausnitzii]